METQSQGAEPVEHGKPEIKIIVNGTPFFVKNDLVSFEQVVKLAYPDLPQGQGIEFQVTYKGAVGKKKDGTLLPNGSVHVSQDKHEPTVFSVDHTFNS